MTQWQPFIRIMIRYIVGALVSNGAIGAATGAMLTEPEVLTAAAALIVGLGTELWYRAAKKGGKPT